MIRPSLTKSLGWVFILLSYASATVHSQMATPQNKGVEPLESFFRASVVEAKNSSVPVERKVLELNDRITAASPEEIHTALPSILTALKSPDKEVKRLATAALMTISLRTDGGRILGSHVTEISDLFNSPEYYFQRGAAVILGVLRPSPPPEAIPPMVSFLERTDRDLPAQRTTLGTLARFGGENPQARRAILDFLSRPMNVAERIDALNAMGDPRVKDPILINKIVASLHDPDPQARLAAINVITRIGKLALSRAEPDLHRLAEGTDEPQEVKAAAQEALREIQRAGLSEQINRAGANEIGRLLPSIVAALANPDDAVKLDATIALSQISARPDSAALLTPFISDIAGLLKLPDRSLQHMGAFLLSSLKPSSPPEVVPPLLAFLKRTDCDTEEQADLIFVLAHYVRDYPEVGDAIERFLARPLEVKARIVALTGLGSSHISSGPILDEVILSLRDPNQDIRLAAIETLTRLGPQALPRAEPDLQRIANRADESPDVREAAKRAFNATRR
ncbi:MAG: HEAT repeat domain-containing protein [Acidobacteriia bacterium]|nr:HEAT repeat domain-containing protein [Terriglobia bacterium]